MNRLRQLSRVLTSRLQSLMKRENARRRTHNLNVFCVQLVKTEPAQVFTRATSDSKILTISVLNFRCLDSLFHRRSGDCFIVFFHWIAMLWSPRTQHVFRRTFCNSARYWTERVSMHLLLTLLAFASLLYFELELYTHSSRKQRWKVSSTEPCWCQMKHQVKAVLGVSLVLSSAQPNVIVYFKDLQQLAWTWTLQNSS